MTFNLFCWWLWLVWVSTNQLFSPFKNNMFFRQTADSNVFTMPPCKDNSPVHLQVPMCLGRGQRKPLQRWSNSLARYSDHMTDVSPAWKRVTFLRAGVLLVVPSMVFYLTTRQWSFIWIFHQGGTRSLAPLPLTYKILTWFQGHLAWSRAVHLPGVGNQVADGRLVCLRNDLCTGGLQEPRLSAY